MVRGVEGIYVEIDSKSFTVVFETTASFVAFYLMFNQILYFGPMFFTNLFLNNEILNLQTSANWTDIIEKCLKMEVNKLTLIFAAQDSS